MLNIHDVWVDFSQLARQVRIHLDTSDIASLHAVGSDVETVARLIDGHMNKCDITVGPYWTSTHEQNIQIDSQTGKELFNLWCRNVDGSLHIIWINCMECITNAQTISSDSVVHQYRINATPEWVISRLKFLDDESKTAFILLNG